MSELGQDSDKPRQAESHGRNYILPAVGHMRIDSITEQQWQNIINNAKSVRQHLVRTSDGQLSKKTLMNLREQIVSFCKFCRRSGLIDFTPELAIPRNRETVPKQILQPNDLARFLADRSTDWHYLRAWQLAVLYGLRPGEVLGIQIKDIQGDTLWIRRAVNDKGKVTAGKNENAKRQEHIFPFAANLIREQIRSRKTLSNWLFPSPKGTQPSQQASRNELQKYLSANDMPKLTPYELRHTFVSVMKSRLSEEFVKMVVGHSESMDTFGVYGHFMHDDVARVGDALADVWNTFTKTN